MTGHAVELLMRQGTRTIHVEAKCPESAVFFTSFFDHIRNAFVVVMDDESFPLLADGGEYPLSSPPEITVEG